MQSRTSVAEKKVGNGVTVKYRYEICILMLWESLVSIQNLKLAWRRINTAKTSSISVFS